MAIRTVDTLKEGMKLDSPVKNQQGQVLFGKDLVLKTKHIDMMMAWGIQEADVVTEEEDDEAAQRFKEQMMIAEEKLKPRFRRCNLTDPLIAETIRCVAEHQIQRENQQKGGI